MRLNTRVVTVASTVTIAGSLFAAAPAGATTVATDSRIAATSYRNLNVPGLPISVQAPSNWPAFSPKSLAAKPPATYPGAVVSLAKSQKMTPAAFIKKNAGINLMSFGGINTKYYASVNVMDAGTAKWRFADVLATLKSNKLTKVNTTSQVKTKFGVVYRAHYRSTNAAGYSYYGVMSLVNLKGNTILIDNTSSSAGDSLDMSNRTLSSADWR